MKVICVIVMSVDGKTTQGNNPSIYHWTSKEDQDYFFSLLNQHTLLLMGRNTYEHAKHLMKHVPKRLRIVFTTTPEQFAKEAIPHMLSFTNRPPKEVLQEAAKKGYKEALLLGGATTNNEFFKDKLVDEVWITTEPYLFGNGQPFMTQKLLIKLQLINIEKLNSQGTLLLKYKVLA